MSDWIGLLEKWQSLAAGLLGIVAAIIGGTFIFFQIAEGRRQERERQARRHAAARAVMPLALSRICDYAKATALVLNHILASGRGSGIPTSTGYPTFPGLPSDQVEPFAAIIESASAETAASVTQLLLDLQIHSSRLLTLSADLASHTSVITTHNIEGNIVDALELYARSEAFFEYARGRSGSISEHHMDVTRVMNALNIVGIHSPSNSMIDSIKRRAEKYAPPKSASRWTLDSLLARIRDTIPKKQ